MTKTASMKPAGLAEAAPAATFLRNFINPFQLDVIGRNCRGEEGEWFHTKLVELAAQIKDMPSSYMTDGQGDKAIAHLHYFTAGMDFYITETDRGADDDGADHGKQFQAFGLAKAPEWELGYISIHDLIRANVEIDLHWTPKTLAECRNS